MAGTFGSGTFGSGTFADPSGAATGAPDPITLTVTIDDPAGAFTTTATVASVQLDLTIDDPAGAPTDTLTGSVDTSLTLALTVDDPAGTVPPVTPTFGLGAFGWGTFGASEAASFFGDGSPDVSVNIDLTIDNPSLIVTAPPTSATVLLAIDDPTLTPLDTNGAVDETLLPLTIDPPTGNTAGTAAPDPALLPLTIDPPTGVFTGYRALIPSTSIDLPLTIGTPTGSRPDADTGTATPALTAFITFSLSYPSTFTQPTIPNPAIVALDNPDRMGAATADGTTIGRLTMPWRFPYSFNPQPTPGASTTSPPLDAGADGIGAVTSTSRALDSAAFPLAFPLCSRTVTAPGDEGGTPRDETKAPVGPWLAFPALFPWPQPIAVSSPPPVEQPPDDAPVEIPEEEEPILDRWGRAPMVDPVVPRPRPLAPVPAMHVLGIGPWSSSVIWHGAPNYGVRRNTRQIAGPIVPLPPATNLSFTLRLEGASEATCEFLLPRNKAFVVDELTTDLWWRRRDGYTHAYENIGRFNADKVDITESDDGVHIAVSWVDYRGLMGERLVLQYAHSTTTEAKTKNAQGVVITTKDVNVDTAWAANSKTSEVLLFIYEVVQNMPVNWNSDLIAALSDDVLSGSSEDPLYGVLKTPFEIALGTSVADALKNLAAVSSAPFEWDVALPHTRSVAPEFVIYPMQDLRGADKGIVLFDVATGSGAIASWSMQGAADKYVNNLFFSGADGGVVLDIEGEVAQYQQRDGTDTDNSLKNVDIAPVELAGRKRLTELSDRRPTWTIVLKTGFWQGRQHIDVGDWVTVHIRLGEDIVGGKYRVTELACEVDSAGAETVTLTLGRPTTSSDPRSRNSALAKLVRNLKAYQSMESSA